MAANVYECMFLLDTNRVAGDVSAAAKQLHAILEKHHAEILASRPWDERRLAYPIGSHKKGLYYLIYFRTEGNNLLEMQGSLHLNEMVLRSMILKIDPKLVETMLTLARDEHAVALHTIQDEPAEEGAVAPVGAGPAVEGEEERSGPRRGPRRVAETADKD